jgi:hypothetical protein
MFDPYRKWLGIRTDQAKPTHYQILGVSEDETDREISEEAAIRQTTHVRAYQAGQHAAVCARVLKEISAARQTLLDPAKRKAYDAQLKRTLKGSPTDDFDDFGEDASTAVSPAPLRERKTMSAPKSKLPLILGASVGGGVLLVGIVLAITIGGSTPEKPKDDKVVQIKKPVIEPEPIVNKVIPEPANPKPNPPIVQPPMPNPGVGNPNPNPPLAEGGSKGMFRPGEDYVSLFFFPDGKKAGWVWNNVLNIHDLDDENAKPIKVALPDFRKRGTLESSRDGSQVIAASQKENSTDGNLAYVWRAAEPDQVVEIPLPPSINEALCPLQARLSPDNRTIAAVSVLLQNGNTVRNQAVLVEVASKKILKEFTSKRGILMQVRFSADGTKLHAVCGDGIVLWDIATGNETFFPASLQFPGISPNGKTAWGWRIEGMGNRTLLLYDIPSGQKLLERPGMLPSPVFAADSNIAFLHKGVPGEKHAAEIIDTNNGETLSQDLIPQVGFPLWLSDSGKLLLLPYRSPKELLSQQMPPFSRQPTKNPPVHGKNVPPIDVPPKNNPLKDDPPMRAALPDKAAVEAKQKIVREQYKKEYAGKTSAEMASLAGKLTQLAEETKDDPASVYVLYDEARELAEKSGRPALALKAAVAICDRYDVKTLPLKIAAVNNVAKTVNTADCGRELVDVARVVLGEAVMQDDFDNSLKTIAVLELAAKRLANPTLTSQVQKQAKLVRDMAKELEERTKAEALLATDAKNAEANWVVGRFLAFRRGDWDKAMPHLALAPFAEIRAAAVKDADMPQDSKDQFALGDLWWEAAEKQPAWKAALQWRAGYWFKQAMPNLTGLNLLKAEQRAKAADEPPSLFAPITASGPAKIYKGHTGIVSCLALSKDGKRLYSSAHDGTLREWNSASGKGRIVVGPPFAPGPMTWFALKPDSTQACVAGPGYLSVIDLAALKPQPLRRDDKEYRPGFFWAENDNVFFILRGEWGTLNMGPRGGGGWNPFVVGETGFNSEVSS